MENKLMALMAFAVIAVFLVSTTLVSADNAAAEKWKEKAKNFVGNASGYREQMKEQVKACKENTTAGNCTQVKEEAIGMAKEVLKNSIERLSRYIDNVNERIEASEKLTDDEKVDIKAALEEQKDKLDIIITELDEAGTFAEVKQIARELRNISKAIHYKVLEIVQMRRIGTVVVRAEHLETKLDKVLDRLEAEGYNISELQEQIDSFNGHIESANASYNEARELWDQFFELVANQTTEGKSELVQQAQDKMTDAKAQLKEAQTDLKQIVQALKDMKVESELMNETSENNESHE